MIAIPVIDLYESKYTIAGGLSSLGHICLYDQYSAESVWMKISALAENMGEFLVALKGLGVKTIITSKIQPMALQVLNHQGFSVLMSEGHGLEENIRKCERGELAHFDMEVARKEAFVCGDSCAVCSISCEAIDKIA